MFGNPIKECQSPAGDLDSFIESTPKFNRVLKNWQGVNRVEKIVTTANKPCKRFSFCSVCIEDRIYVWGGRNNKQTFDVVENSMYILHLKETPARWEIVHDEESVYKSSLTGATPVVYDGKIWVWGGYSTKYHNDMNVFDPKTKAWGEVKQNGTKPQRRWHYSAAVHNKKMYMFGGTFDQTHHTDLHIFDFETQTWSQCEGINPPSRPRRRHRQVVWRNKLYIIGGKEDSDTANTMLVYDIDKNKWSELTDNEVDTVRGCPIPSSHDHSLHLQGDEVYLFGSKPHRVWKYNFIENVWMTVTPANYLQSGLWNIPSHHGNPAYWNGSVYFFGGRTAESEMISNDTWRFILNEPTQFNKLSNLLTEQREFSNVQFIIKGRTIYADRCILYAKSEYFRQMFKSNFAEKLHNNVILPVDDCSYKVFYSIIRFLYSDEMWSPTNWQEVLALLKQADKYLIQPLRKHYANQLLTMVNLDNAVELWRAGTMLNLYSLKQLCLEHLGNNFPDLVETGKWDTLVEERSGLALSLTKELGVYLAKLLVQNKFSRLHESKVRCDVDSFGNNKSSSS